MTSCRDSRTGAHDLHAIGNYYAYVGSSWGGWPSEGGVFVNNTVVLIPPGMLTAGGGGRVSFYD